MNIRIRKGKPNFFSSNDPRRHLSLPNSPLILAILDGNYNIFKQFIEFDEESIQIALWVATAYRRTEMAAHLLQQGANPNKPCLLCHRYSFPLQIATAVPDNYDCILLLLDHGADFFIKTID